MSTEKRLPDVDRKTAKGKGEGGFAPHPETPGPPENFDPHSYRPPDGNDAKGPRDNTKPIPPQPSADPEGTGHEEAKGGIPEKQPTKKEQ
jgi:hypothetical protein